MADRPVFMPREQGSRLVDEVPISFGWNPGMSATQKKKNVTALHAAAKARGIDPLLEVSSKSQEEVGRRLSAFSLKTNIVGFQSTVESVFQGSKVFEQGGPYTDLYAAESRDAKRDERLRSSGRLIGFALADQEFELSPPTAFYDWIYINALFPYRDWLARLRRYAGFTDIEFNPTKSINCQARSLATFMALMERGGDQLTECVDSFSHFRDKLRSAEL